jgi:ABC-type transporter Mla MlaB component
MSARFDLPAELNIYNVLETRDALLAWVTAQTAAGKDHLEISAKDVAEVDGSGLQLLAALTNTEAHWSLIDSSDAFNTACRTLGFSHWLTSTGA